VTAGSAVWSGALPLDQADALSDAGGLSFAEARAALGDLAGDWVDTGLPATLEGAAQSGHAAARLALAVAT